MKFQVLFSIVPAFVFGNLGGQNSALLKTTHNEDEARIIGIVEAIEASPKLKDDEQQELQFIKNGFCQWGIEDWHKPGSHLRSNCMKCTCVHGGKWSCSFFFDYCPYFYCGNEIYNPSTQFCCFGKKYMKREHFKCCGYFYYSTKTSKCCNYYSVKPVKDVCPRHRV